MFVAKLEKEPTLTTDSGCMEYHVDGVWQQSVLPDGTKINIPTNSPTFTDHYGTVHRFEDGLHHGAPSIVTKSGTKWYHYKGMLVGKLNEFNYLYYDFVGGIPMRHTDVQGYTYKRAGDHWELISKNRPGTRIGIIIGEKTIKEEWKDVFGINTYTYENGILIERKSVNSWVHFNPNGTVKSAICTAVPAKKPKSVVKDSEEWVYIDDEWSSITVNGETTLIQNAREIDEPEPTMLKTGLLKASGNKPKDDSSRTRSGKVYKPVSIEPVSIEPPRPNMNPIQVLDQIKQFIPSDPAGQTLWLEHFKLEFEKFQAHHLAQQVIAGYTYESESEILYGSDQFQREYMVQLSKDFYTVTHQARRVGQVLRLFKHRPDLVGNFTQLVDKNMNEFILHCLQILYDNNPKHVGLICEVKWDWANTVD